MADQSKKNAHTEPKETTSADSGVPQPSKVHRLKITQMSLHDVEEALENVRKFMGSYNSRYALALLARKEFLVQNGRSVSPAAKAA